jgi:hypothetical protein
LKKWVDQITRLSIKKRQSPTYQEIGIWCMEGFERYS